MFHQSPALAHCQKSLIAASTHSYGFRTFRILELALYHSLGKLPEPELTHEFF
jgi:hypothetical protein